ncbi:hypothetical protein [Streptacidiphilus anmyonensis]|uniref:hypothetical protein n=1 Tax=Streptacidiphilus anmyonensis TaxID=405782 RepID=UPI0005AB2812|nr:hypothetical protein [Streptacidiphilus anmyonensis]
MAVKTWQPAEPHYDDECGCSSCYLERLDRDDAIAQWCDPGALCQICEAGRPAFDAEIARFTQRWKRSQDPEHNPYAAGKNTLHRVSCKFTVFDVGSDHPMTEPFDYTSELRQHAHRSRIPGEYVSFGMHMSPLTAGEAASWITSRTGPAGGKKYRLCRTCRPEM